MQPCHELQVRPVLTIHLTRGVLAEIACELRTGIGPLVNGHLAKHRSGGLVCLMPQKRLSGSFA